MSAYEEPLPSTTWSGVVGTNGWSEGCCIAPYPGLPERTELIAWRYAPHVDPLPHCGRWRECGGSVETMVFRAAFVEMRKERDGERAAFLAQRDEVARLCVDIGNMRSVARLQDSEMGRLRDELARASEHVRELQKYDIRATVRALSHGE